MSSKTPCVLVTGVGAIIGQGIIKSLRMDERPVHIVGLDLNPQAFGARDCDAFYAKPEDESSEAYQRFLEELIKTEKIDLILPGIEHDIFFLDEHRKFFEALQVSLVLNHHELIEVSRDKWKTACALQSEGIQTIPGIIPTSWKESLTLLGAPPLLMKPRCGNGSRGIVRLYEQRDFDYWVQNRLDKVMIQKIVGSDDEEYTVAVFGFGDGESTVPIAFRRKLSASGSTQSAEIVHDESINLLIEQLNRLFLPLGPTNYQFRKESETVYLLEVNPRISSATSFRAAFDYNEAWMSIDYFMHGKKSNPEPLRQGRAERYTEDWVDRR